MHSPRRPRKLERLILLAVLSIVEHPIRALVIAGILLAVCGGVALAKLNISSDEDKLFSEHVKFFHDYLEFDRKFPENEAVYVIVETKDPQAQPTLAQWTGIADSIAKQMRAIPKYVESADARIPLDKLGNQGLLFNEPDSLHANFEDAKRLQDLARLWGQRNVTLPGIPRSLPLAALLGRTPIERYLSGVALIGPSEESVVLTHAIADGWLKAVREPDRPIVLGDQVPDLERLGADTPHDLGYYFVADEQNKKQSLMLIRVFPRAQYDALTSISDTVAHIRAAAKRGAAGYESLFNVGVTGRPALDADEMETTDRDSMRSEIVAAIAVFIGLVVMLRSLWLAFVAELALGVGIGWTFGWATVTVHELNLLSIVFLIALIGIGMDYLVQVLTRYRVESRRHERAKAVWFRVFKHVSAPINTACLGAAGAFFVSIFTDFRGAAELGIVAGGGLILCLIAGYTVLPAILTLWPGKFVKVDVALRSVEPPPTRGPRRLVLPIICVALLCVLAFFIPRTQFNPNLLDLQAPHLESTELIRKLPTWSEVILSKDLNSLRAARSAIEHLPAVASTESFLTAQDNYQWLQQHKDELTPIEWSKPPAVEASDLSAIAKKATTLADRIDAGAKEAKKPQEWNETAASLRAFADALKSPSSRIAERLTTWQEGFVVELQHIMAELAPPPPDLAAVPYEMRSHLVSADGTYALYVYPKYDLWNRARLKAFVSQIEGAVARVPGDLVVTGIASDIYHTTGSIRTAFIHATVYALALIVILVLIDLRDVRQMLFAVSVLALGLPMLVGVMGLIGLDWNFANFFGLPILIGAGHEYGVFMIHRYREVLHDPRRVWRSWDVADRALLLCAYVTCSSFAFFWALGHHRGLKSLGLVMAVGTGCIYLSTVLVLRPILKWRLERKRRQLERREANPSPAIYNYKK